MATLQRDVNHTSSSAVVARRNKRTAPSIGLQVARDINHTPTCLADVVQIICVKHQSAVAAWIGARAHCHLLSDAANTSQTGLTLLADKQDEEIHQAQLL